MPNMAWGRHSLLQGEQIGFFLKMILTFSANITSLLQLSQIKEAEEALIEANFLNNEDPEVWAYLCMVSMQKCRHFEAKQAYKYALRVCLPKIN